MCSLVSKSGDLGRQSRRASIVLERENGRLVDPSFTLEIGTAHKGESRGGSDCVRPSSAKNLGKTRSQGMMSDAFMLGAKGCEPSIPVVLRMFSARESLFRDIRLRNIAIAGSSFFV